jgi:hypothetical protein
MTIMLSPLDNSKHCAWVQPRDAGLRFASPHNGSISISVPGFGRWTFLQRFRASGAVYATDSFSALKMASMLAGGISGKMAS